MTILHVIPEGILLVQLAPQGVKPLTEGSAFPEDVSISKAGLYLASPKAIKHLVFCQKEK